LNRIAQRPFKERARAKPPAQRLFDPAPLLPVPALLPAELSAPPPLLPLVRSVALAMSARGPLAVDPIDELPLLPDCMSVELQAAKPMAISPAISTL
jgi:hypothetical protein